MRNLASDVDGENPRLRTSRSEAITLLSPDILKKSSLIRIVDFAVSLFLCLLTLPLMAVVALLIKVFDRGPVFFSQTRVGLGMRKITVVKFRTMVPGADKHEETILEKSGEPNVQIPRDMRITRLGAILRRLRLDELPQLFLVLFGKISLVGPRPLIFAEVRRLPVRFHDRFRVMPGITGLAQVSGRARLSVWEILEYDLKWVQEYSFSGYVKILLKTLFAVLRTKEAT